MATGTEATPETAPARLRQGSIGPVGMIFMVVAATAPLTALATNIAVGLGYGVGVGTVGLFVAVAVVLGIFSVGYLLLARYVRSAGGQAAFVSFGLGKPAGTAIAFVATIAYNAAVAGMVTATSFYGCLAIEQLTGVTIPWYVAAVAVLVLIGLLGLRGVQAADKVTLVASLLQFVFVGALAVAVLVQRPEGWTLEPFEPGRMFSGNLALTLVFVLLSFAGFEASTIYSEEARGGHRSVRIATYASLALLTVVFVVATWTLVAAYPDVAAVAAADPASVVTTMADQYIGSWSGSAILVLITVSFFGAAIALHNLAVRYQYALARAGLLPAALLRTSGRHASPYVSSLVQVGVSFVLLVPFVLIDADLFATLLPAISGITALSLIAMMASASVSVIVARARNRITGGLFASRIAPGLSAVVLLGVGVLIVANYPAVTGSESPVIAAMPLIPLLAGVYGAIRQSRLPDSPGVEGYLD